MHNMHGPLCNFLDPRYIFLPCIEIHEEELLINVFEGRRSGNILQEEANEMGRYNIKAGRKAKCSFSLVMLNVFFF